MSVEERRKLARLNNNRYLGLPYYYYTKRGVWVLVGSAMISYFVGQFIGDMVVLGGVFIALAYILMLVFPVDYLEKENPFYIPLLKKLKNMLVFVVVVLLSGCASLQGGVKKEVKTYMDVIEKEDIEVKTYMDVIEKEGRGYRDPVFEKEVFNLLKNTRE